MAKRKITTENQKEAVLQLFYTEFDNSIPTIASMTNLHQSVVNRIINVDLKQKKK